MSAALVLTTAPANPAVGRVVFYATSTGLHMKNSAGTITKLSDNAVGTEYRATLLGANGALTSTTVSKTDFSMALTGAYSAEGVYTLTAASGTPFTADKTIVKVFNAGATGAIIYTAVVTSTTVITISTFAADGTTPADAIGKFFVEITVDA
jgi:hypothetical protein